MTHDWFVADLIAAVAVIGSLAGWLPPIVSIIGLAWYGVLFYDRFVSKK